MKIAPVTLEGSHVRLEPLTEAHHEGLCAVGFDPELWRLNLTRVTNREEMMGYIRQALDWQKAGTALPFATIEASTGRVIGSTRYMNIDVANRRLEIGATWIAPEWQRTLINAEAKFLMLRHAFETLGAMRVELKTDTLNKRSRNAMQRMGARQEGIFRNHMTTWSGRIRHTIYFSIIDAEWPRVKARLEAKLSSKETSPLRRVDTLSDTQVEDLCRLFRNEGWMKNRTIEEMQQMLDGTPLQIAFADASDGRLVGFMRVLTDGVFKAIVLGLIVDPAWRGRGVGRKLMEEALAHPQLASLKTFELYCEPELAGFYERFGFRDAGEGLRFMRRV